MKLFKCLNCHSEAVDEIIYANKVAYQCYVCTKILPQAYSMDSRVKFALTKNNKPKHFMTAMILVNNQKEVLMINRRAFPFAWSLVLGHIHNGESLKSAGIRELMEETGITSKHIKYLFTTTVNNACDIGVDKHMIYAFKVTVPHNALIIPNSEAREARWLSSSEIKKLDSISGKAKAVLKKAKII